MPFVPRGSASENPQSSEQFRSMSQIEIHTTKDTYGPGRKLDPTLSLQSWHFKKTLSSSQSSNEIGTLSLQLTAGVIGQSPTSTWDEFVSVMDFIVVYASDDGPKNMRTRFIGYITDINYVEDTGSNPQNPQRSIQIQASDAMLGLQTELVWTSVKLTPVAGETSSAAFDRLYAAVKRGFSSYGSSQSGNVPILLWLLAFLGKSTKNSSLWFMSPSQTANLLVQNVMPALFAAGVSIRSQKFSGVATWLDIITQTFGDTSQFSGAFYFLQAQSGGIYSTLQSMMNAPFLEFFGDVRSADQMTDIPAAWTGTKKGIAFGPDNASFNLVIRNTPFDTTSGAPGTKPRVYETLPITDVYLKETTSRQWGTTTSDVLNYFYSYPEGYLQQSKFLAAINTSFGALVDTDSVAKYGMRPLEIPVLGYPTTYGTSFSPSQMMAWNQTLYDWYHLNPQYIRGTATVHGNPALRVGTRVRFPAVGLTGYVEGVDEQYVAFQSYTATVTFSRGVVAS